MRITGPSNFDSKFLPGKQIKLWPIMVTILLPLVDLNLFGFEDFVHKIQSGAKRVIRTRGAHLIKLPDTINNMTAKKKKIKGWSLIYIITSIPILMFYSAGLSGWILEYPLWLFFTIFFIFSIPLVLIIFKSPKAPKWNIRLVWSVFILITLRIIYGILFQNVAPLLLAITAFSFLWATIWTKYFKKL